MSSLEFIPYTFIRIRNNSVCHLDLLSILSLESDVPYLKYQMSNTVICQNVKIGHLLTCAEAFPVFTASQKKHVLSLSIYKHFCNQVKSVIVAAATINLLVKNPSKICSNFLTKACRETPRVSN